MCGAVTPCMLALGMGMEHFTSVDGQAWMCHVSKHLGQLPCRMAVASASNAHGVHIHTLLSRSGRAMSAAPGCSSCHSLGRGRTSTVRCPVVHSLTERHVDHSCHNRRAPGRLARGPLLVGRQGWPTWSSSSSSSCGSSERLCRALDAANLSGCACVHAQRSVVSK